MVPLAYNYRNLFVRWKTTLMTAAGFTLVVAALIVMLAFVNGVQRVCAVTGEPENVVVLKDGNVDEVLSQLDVGLVNLVENVQGVGRDAQGRPLASRELFMVVANQDPVTGVYGFLQTRGVLPQAFAVHTVIKVVEGRNFHPSQSEVIIGRGVQREIGKNVGDTFRMGRKDWKVAGIFEAGGGAFESEIWCDVSELAGHFRHEGIYSSVILRTAGPKQTEALLDRLDHSPFKVESMSEPAYYERQANQTQVISQAAIVISVFMAIGAVFGVMNTMFAAIGQRTKDIAVMRILGFSPKEIVVSFLMEAMLIATVGGLAGTGIGYAVNGMTRSAGLGAKSVEFAFRVDARIVLVGVIFTFIMGLLGGLLPALHSMRIKALDSLR